MWSATPTEPVSARVLQEAGARVGFNAFLPDINVGVPATDTRRIGVLAQDLPCFISAQLAVNIILRKALTINCAGQPQAENSPELARSWRCRLVVGIETGGRWGDEEAEVVRQLACARARDVPCHLARPAELAWERRWTRVLSTICAVSFAASLVEPM